MNIKVLDSWLREHLETKATPKQIGEILSQTSVSVEKIESLGRDHLYDIEVTTNRPDLMSVVGIAREASAALSASNIPAKFILKKIPEYKIETTNFPIKITNDPNLVNRICAAVVSIKLNKSPQLIRDRLEATDIRSINNAVDVTNYVMRELGHPVHAFDFDKLKTGKMVIREGKKGEKITTLDKKEYVLRGGEIVADDTEGNIIDLLGIMGLQNTAVDESTKRVLLFIDNNDKYKIRRASMDHEIRTDAAVLNEKGVDSELAYRALARGVELLEQIAEGKLESGILDIYPNKISIKPVSVSLQKINQVMGVDVMEKNVIDILEGLDFTVKKGKNGLVVTPPSARAADIKIPQDLIEEVARIYGYHNLPSILPETGYIPPLHLSTNQFFWEKNAKDAFRYFGFTEVYTYSLISEDMLEVPTDAAVKISNPLGNEFAFMRTTLIPNLLQAVRENKSFESIRIFELSNVYYKKPNDLPLEILFLSGVVKNVNASFFEVKGFIESLLDILGVKKYEFRKTENKGAGADLFVWGKKLGEIEILDRSIIDFEINFTELMQYVSQKKTYVPIPKFPPAIEDVRVVMDPSIEYSKIVHEIKKVSNLIKKVELLDTYQDKKTFRITYQSNDKNLTNTEITELREKILTTLKNDLHAELA